MMHTIIFNDGGVIMEGLSVSYILAMRNNARKKRMIAENHLNYAESEYAIDKAIYTMKLAEDELHYSILLGTYLKHLPTTKDKSKRWWYKIKSIMGGNQ